MTAIDLNIWVSWIFANSDVCIPMCLSASISLLLTFGLVLLLQLSYYFFETCFTIWKESSSTVITAYVSLEWHHSKVMQHDIFSGSRQQCILMAYCRFEETCQISAWNSYWWHSVKEFKDVCTFITINPSSYFMRLLFFSITSNTLRSKCARKA